MQLTSFLACCYDGEQTPESRDLLRIGAAIGYLEDHYADPISVEQLTRIAGMSESSLLRAFKQPRPHTVPAGLAAAPGARPLALHRSEHH